MIDSLENITSYTYLVLIVFGFSRFLFFKDKSLWPSILVSLYFITNSSLALAFIGVLEETLSYRSYPLIFNALFLTLSATFVSIIISHYVENLNDKKIKTLLRLPLIGLLAGYSLGFEQVLWIFILLEILIFCIFIRKSQEHKYIFRAQIRALFCLILLFFADGQESLFLPLYFLVSSIFKMPIINAFIVKSMIMKYDEAHD